MKTANPTPAAKPAQTLPPSASSITLPLSFIVVGIVALLTGMIWLAICPEVLATYHYNQYVIALTHLFNLGWITSIIMGATYQLVPVALETKLYSERLARWQFVCHVVGFAGMVWMFWTWRMAQVGHFGSVFSLGVILFVFNLARTLARTPHRTVTWTGIASALTWLTLTMAAGLYLAAAKCWDICHFATIARMHAHAHLGVLGFFIMMIVAVSYKLIPMFTLSAVQNEGRARCSVRLLNTGLALLFFAILTQSRWKPLCALVVIAGLALYGAEIRAILRARKRRNLDWGLRYFVTAISLLLPLSLLALVLSWPELRLTTFTGQLENVYGLLGIAGVVTLALLGMLYKIVPFLVWYGRYSSEIGRNKVPALTDLYSSCLQIWGYWIFVAGLAITTVATALGNLGGVRTGCATLAASCLIFAINMGKIMSHLVRPKSEAAHNQFKTLLEGNYAAEHN